MVYKRYNKQTFITKYISFLFYYSENISKLKKKINTKLKNSAKFVFRKNEVYINIRLKKDTKNSTRLQVLL